jgi:nicotinamidase-related amidase
MVLSFSAKPFDVEGLHVEETALVLIDLQKDFMLPGGFGESLGNDVLQLARCVEPCKRMLAEARKAGMMVIHTREGHRPDLSDCPALKLAKSKPGLRIGDVGPMGRILVRGEDGHDLIDECKPIPGEPIVDKPGKGAFHATDLAQILAVRGIKNILVGGVTSEVCVQTVSL